MPARTGGRAFVACSPAYGKTLKETLVGQSSKSVAAGGTLGELVTWPRSARTTSSSCGNRDAEVDGSARGAFFPWQVVVTVTGDG